MYAYVRVCTYSLFYELMCTLYYDHTSYCLYYENMWEPRSAAFDVG